MLPATAYLDFAPGLRVCRILNGMWQVSGAHGPINPAAAVQTMLDYHADGFTTWDLADHYGPAEDFIGAFRREAAARFGPESLAQSVAFTKWVPRPQPMTRAVVEQAIATSLRRMQVPALDLVQFHWWDYRYPQYLPALRHLANLRDAGQIRHLALTNFDTARVREITEAGIRVVANQVQYSLIDQRPAARLAPYCAEAGIWLLPYGVLCGGLISERYLGAPEPTTAALTTASLRKYKQMIDVWGGWRLFQSLLATLKAVADKHGVSIANVATRWTLDQPQVAGVIIGVRLGVADHRAENARVFQFALDDADRAAIAAVTGQGRDLLRAIGDCGDEYR
ncbi:MAG: aldo/keto reductase [Dehalococcoidia bacterium]|nr:aldo/keto reductase [Dehalococcoidia bacterium]